MLEHLLSPEFDDPTLVDTPTLLAAQANTASLLEQLGSPEHVLEEDERYNARQAFAAVTNPNLPTPDTNAAVLKLKTPAAVKHLAGMLTQYDWEYVEQASQIRSYVVAKLMEETTHPDAKIRISALKALGNVTEVGAFTERIQVTKVDATPEEIKERVRDKLLALRGRPGAVEDVDMKPAADAA